MSRFRGGVVAIAALCVASPSFAGPLDRAKAAIEQSDYFAARSALDETLRSGTNKPDELAEIHRLIGYVAGALGDAQAAQVSFERCLSLAPASALPAGTSPRILKSFIAAQEAFKTKKPLELKTQTSADPPWVKVELVSDPMKMVVTIRAMFVVDGKKEQTLDKPADKPVTIELPKGKRIDLQIAALDEHGNRLKEAGSKAIPIVIVGKPDPTDVVVVKPKPRTPAKPFVERPLYLRWWMWAGTAAVFLAAGSYFGIEAIQTKGELDDLNTESANHSFDEAQAIESRARRDVLFANIGLIAGGAFAVTAAVLYLTRPKRSADPSWREWMDPAKPVTLAPMVHPRGGGLVLGGHF